MDVATADYPVSSTCYATALNDIYGRSKAYDTNQVRVGPLNLSGFASATGFRMIFKTWFHLDCGYDMAILQYSTNGSTFTDVSSDYVSGYTNRPNNPAYTNAWSPDPAAEGVGWRSVTIDLGGLSLNGKTTVYFRWALSSDDMSEGTGFYVDDIDIGY